MLTELLIRNEGPTVRWLFAIAGPGKTAGRALDNAELDIVALLRGVGLNNGKQFRRPSPAWHSLQIQLGREKRRSQLISKQPAYRERQ